MNQKIKFTIEQEIIHSLLVKSASVDDIGLFNGKLGIAIAFFEYGKFLEENILTEYGYNLIDGYLNKIDYSATYSFASGLAGIGWGIEYLIENNFIINNCDYVCTKIDERIMAVDIRRISDLSLETGLEGILHYTLSRIEGAFLQKSNIPFDKVYLTDLLNNILCIKEKLISNDLRLLIRYFKNFIENNAISSGYKPSIPVLIKDSSKSIIDIQKSNPGLKSGLAGHLLMITLTQ